jgi:anti-sigma factor RsiW
MRDLELLSAYLDRELSQGEKTRLISRIVKEPELARALEDLRQTRSMLRRTPQRKAPRNFTLTPKMVGIRPPVPRVVPALSWASAVAALMFVCTMGYNFIAMGGAFGAASPKANDSYGIAQAPATQPPATQPPAALLPATEPPATLAPISPNFVQSPTAPIQVETAQPGQRTRGAQVVTATPTSPILGQGSGSAPTATPDIFGTSLIQPSETPTVTPSVTPTTKAASGERVPAATQPPLRQTFPWAYVWLGLAVLLVGAALLIRWLNRLAFQRKSKR